jgi:hypothetical protein
VSSTKTLDRRAAELSEGLPSEESWVVLRPQRAQSALPRAGRVVAALAGLRATYGEDDDTFDLDAVDGDYGSGDPALTEDIERAVVQHWDA